MKIEFDVEAYKKLGEELVKDAEKYSKEAGQAVLAYTLKVAELTVRMQTGDIEPENAKRAIARYKRAMTIALAAAKVKMDWSLARKYMAISSEFVTFIEATLGQLIKFL
jgi:hypothetical protein